MRQVWKFGLRWVSVLGLAGTLLMSGGCGGGGGDDGNTAENSVVKDTTPEPFTIAPHVSAPLGTPIISSTVVRGINAPTPISISDGGTYSINGGAFTSAAGTVNGGQVVAVRHTTANTNSTITTSTLTIGGVSAVFTTITSPPAGGDTVPAAFSFTPQTGVPVGTIATSNPITVTGIDNPAPITITGGTYSINGGEYTSSVGLIVSGQSVTVRHTSSAAANTPTTTTLTIGGVSAGFTTKTALPAGSDTTPDTFSFTPQTGVPINMSRISNEVTVTGINTPTSISVTGGTYSINGRPSTSFAGTVNNGDTVRVWHTSATTSNTVTTTTLTIGGVAASFTTTTVASTGDTTPDTFTFTAQDNVRTFSTIISNMIVVQGIDTPAPISITGGTYSINSGTPTSAAGTVINRQSVTVYHTSSARNSSVTTTTLTIGGVSAVFTSTTEPISEAVAALYQASCAECHRLGTLDPTGAAPDLASTTQMIDRFRGETVSHHDVTLTFGQREALQSYFLNF